MADRRKAEARGRRAELLAALWLACKGYRVLARGLRTPVGEIDLVVRRGRVVAAVEVKARASQAAAGEAIQRRQRRRIARALAWFLKGRPELAGADLRFDAVLIGGILPRHLPDAWRPDV
ncbi:MAG: YraN family protein [Thalassobaculales bacterium]